MNNVTQAERNAIQQMDNQVYSDEAESYFENEQENDEDATYDEDEQAFERDAENEQIRN
ncbi:hypothetical protein [Pediococcus ethanolidurans]|uniref:hypothetical protein n=1 Tax=Pediococcus ethanolidurans TaxID=319653 RepID=UPI001C1EBB97|nr:hypothetical protein [Pediococcus ethanolidurans]MBU7554467.1 hypothetical protein [Pediococcus ethanolidurans]